jgi:hypothetical protein
MRNTFNWAMSQAVAGAMLPDSKPRPESLLTLLPIEPLSGSDASTVADRTDALMGSRAD